MRALFGGDVAEGSVEVETWIEVLSKELKTIIEKRELFYVNPGKVKSRSIFPARHAVVQGTFKILL